MANSIQFQSPSLAGKSACLSGRTPRRRVFLCFLSAHPRAAHESAPERLGESGRRVRESVLGPKRGPLRFDDWIPNLSFCSGRRWAGDGSCCCYSCCFGFVCCHWIIEELGHGLVVVALQVACCGRAATNGCCSRGGVLPQRPNGVLTSSCMFSHPLSCMKMLGHEKHEIMSNLHLPRLMCFSCLTILGHSLPLSHHRLRTNEPVRTGTNVDRRLATHGTQMDHLT